MANTKITTSVIADGAITSAKLDTDISVSGSITGTLATAAQPNITSVGTLTGLNVNVGTNNIGATFTSTDQEVLLALDDSLKTTTIESNNGILIFGTNGASGGTSATEAMRIDRNGNVGIGGSPTNYSDHKTLSLYGNTGTGAGFIEFNDTSGNADAVIFSDNGNLFINADYDNTTADSSIRFRVDGSSEKMRIDSSGNLLVGKTSTLTTSVGSQMRADGFISGFRASDAPALFARGTDDGDVVVFRKDSTTVGVIGTEGTDLTIGSGGAGFQFLESENKIRPFNVSTNSASNGVVDLGRANANFKDLYISGAIKMDSDLDDYEEGTFTPTCSAVGTTVFSAKYTKVGDLVTLVVYLETTTANSGTSGNATFTGLPFTSQGNGWSVGSLSIAQANPVNGSPLHVRVQANSSAIDLKKNNDSTMAGSDVDAGHIIWTVSYKAA